MAITSMWFPKVDGMVSGCFVSSAAVYCGKLSMASCQCFPSKWPCCRGREHICSLHLLALRQHLLCQGEHAQTRHTVISLSVCVCVCVCVCACVRVCLSSLFPLRCALQIMICNDIDGEHNYGATLQSCSGSWVWLITWSPWSLDETVDHLGNCWEQIQTPTMTDMFISDYFATWNFPFLYSKLLRQMKTNRSTVLFL